MGDGILVGASTTGDMVGSDWQPFLLRPLFRADVGSRASFFLFLNDDFLFVSLLVLILFACAQGSCFPPLSLPFRLLVSNDIEGEGDIVGSLCLLIVGLFELWRPFPFVLGLG